ncbi:tRNA preQ1(34) S-adenosylmethionine ribosyltransferase-isomerase QueA [Chromatiales bacterium (ex Bugula neritina AB1)]|nr:tRNA preQ1(34) S-adenosylmethionine ribosyltransferase-isomerase QueA [Chromatiales bacterium (ex Bugula neritina AB1)]
MRLSDFDFELPENLIAQFPPVERTGGRLLVVGRPPAEPRHRLIKDLPDLLREGDLLVLNDTKVFPARIRASKNTGGKVELLVERILNSSRALCLCRSSKAPKPGTIINLPDGGSAEVVGRQEDLFEIDFSLDIPLLEYLEQFGSLPLPPYIQRDADNDDVSRYQTVYANETGAIAAPTAGLHFDEALLDRCRANGVETAFVTLHVGAGTFQPVRTDDISEHRMHAERAIVTAELCDRIAQASANGGRVIAVGTTVVRALESAAADGDLQPLDGDTRLFIKPGDPFRVVDALLTNFHLPRSTLLMLVCAFAGTQTMLGAYKQAVENEYRFFSYGDAMMVFPTKDSAVRER